MVINRLDIVLSANVINEIYATKSLAIATYPYAATPTLSTINGVMKKLIITFVEKATNAAIKLIKFFTLDSIVRSNLSFELLTVKEILYFKSRNK